MEIGSRPPDVFVGATRRIVFMAERQRRCCWSAPTGSVAETGESKLDHLARLSSARRCSSPSLFSTAISSCHKTLDSYNEPNSSPPLVIQGGRFVAIMQIKQVAQRRSLFLSPAALHSRRAIAKGSALPRATSRQPK